MRFVTPGLSSPRRRTGGSSESVTARLNFLRIVSGSSSSRTVPCSLPPVVDILRVGLLQVAHARADGRDAVLGHDEDVLPARSAR